MFYIIGLLIFIFWLWMLIDAIMNPRLEGSKKLIWVLVVFFLNGLGALLYYLLARKG